MSMENIKEVVEKYDTWWTNKNQGPLLNIIYPKVDADLMKYAKEWMCPDLIRDWTPWRQEFVFGQAVELTWKTGRQEYVDEAIDLLEKYAKMTDHAAQGYSFLMAGLGAGVLAAFISDFTRFNGHSIWFELEKPMEWEQILKIGEYTRSSYANVAIESIKKLAARLEGKFVFAPPDLMEPLDVFSSLRGVNNLLFDTIDYPDELKQGISILEKLWFNYYKEISDIIDKHNPGCYTDVMRYLSGKPMHTCACDFSAMISPDMFGEYVVPTMKLFGEHFQGRIVYHMDGPGQIKHMNALCGLETLHAIQWVSGAGQENSFSEKWYPLYKQMLEAGKKICLVDNPSSPDVLRNFFKKFPSKEFYVSITLRGEHEVKEYLELENC